MSRDIIEQAKLIKAELMGAVREIKVYELGPEGEPLSIFVEPITSSELKAIWREGDPYDRAVQTIVLRARDKDGNRLFANERSEIERHFPPMLTVGIAQRINEDINSVTADGAIETVGK